MPLSITVVIPAYNEAELLPRCLAAVMPQARALGARVLVIDNNSTDQTTSLAKAAGAEVIHESRQGVVYAMQHGLQEATTDIVAFTDADTVVASGWLDAIKQSFQTPDVVAVTGPIRFERQRLLTWSRILYRRMLFGSNMAIRRSAGLAVGGFDRRYNLASDVAFGWAIKKHGRIVYQPRMSVTTSSRRFQAHPLRTPANYLANHLWMVLFHRPLLWHFSPIRRPKKELDRQATRRIWLAGSAMFIAALLYLSLWPSSSVFGQIDTHGHTRARVVALTFDDGPNGAATRAIVDTLVAKQVPATFFEVGRSVAADPNTSKYVADHAFTIGNHSWDHSFNLPYDSPKHIRRELVQTNGQILAATGLRPQYFRPPHGFRSPQLLFEAKRQHLEIIDWNVDPQDYMTQDVQTIINRVMRHIHPGSIVLLHDGLQDGFRVKQLIGRHGTITALPIMIDQLRQQGYTFVSLRQLLPPETETPHPLDLGRANGGQSTATTYAL